MISFIVIGKDEGERLKKCFTSIFNVIERDNIKAYEVIYIDSRSTDDSLKLAQSYEKIEVLLITGECNAAIARNIGAKEAKGDILFFIDGDMEIEPAFLPSVLDEKEDLAYPFVSGIFIDLIYDDRWNFISSRQRINVKPGGQYYSTVGGLFLITRELWLEQGGMDTRQKLSQDFDLALRMAKKGVPLYRKDRLLAYHHMISYGQRLEYVDNIKYTALLFRKHWNNKYYVKTFISQQYTTILMFVALLFLLATPYACLIYLFPLIYKSLNLSRANHITFFKQSSYVFLRDIYFYKALLFFKPPILKLSYKHVSKC